MRKNMADNADERKAKYHIIIETANAYIGAEGEHNLVTLQMTGKDGKVTEELNLNHLGEPHFRRGERDVFEVEAIDVGLPMIIRLELREHEGKNPWAVRHVEVKYNDQMAHFPVHDWIETNMSFTTGQALPYHKVNNAYLISMMKEEVDSKRVLVPWMRRPEPTNRIFGLPRFLDATKTEEVPLMFQPTEVWMTSANVALIAENARKALADIKKNSYKLDSLEDYELLYKIFEEGKERSAFLDRWRSDEEFGRQHLNSACPITLKRCTELPKSCRVTCEHIGDLLKGNTLEEEMKTGKVYIGDFSEVLRGLKRNKNSRGEQLYCPDALCLFHVNSNDNLVPIAIQLVPDDEDTIFTPNDSELDWLLAKIYYKVAFTTMHVSYYHLLSTHIMLEPFAVGVYRNLPRCHPIFKLLRPHLHNIPMINLLAWQAFIHRGSAPNAGVINTELVARHTFKSFDMEDLEIHSRFKKYGLMDKNLLPKYYYRDDSLELWEIINDFVTGIIQFYYPDDSDVCSDRFLQGMMEDIVEEGFEGVNDQTYKGILHQMCNVEKLIRLCTTVIFTSAVQHTAINYPQYEMYKFVPNCPSMMRLPPHKKGEATMERIISSLPDVGAAVAFIAIQATLNVYFDDEIFLGDYPMKLFTEDEPQKVILKFQKDLEGFSKRVKKRNEETKYPYDWLLPEKIPNCLAV